MNKFIISILLAVIPAIAFAEEGGESAPKPKKEDPEAIFKSLDKNKDGKVSKEEFMANKKGEWAAQGEKNFAAKDKDKDGFLTLEEFSAKKKK